MYTITKSRIQTVYPHTRTVFAVRNEYGVLVAACRTVEEARELITQLAACPE